MSSRRQITTDFLYKRTNNRQVKEIMDGLTKSIDDVILSRHRENYSDVNYELPENFVIQNLSLIDAQTLIYSQLILIYEEKGFKVRLHLNPTIMNIKWEATLNPDDKKKMTNIIKNHLV